MGRQVTACLLDLVEAGCAVRHENDVLEGDPPVSMKYAVVTFPDGRKVHSYTDDCLHFDCRNRASGNFWALEQLIDLGVPFNWA